VADLGVSFFFFESNIREEQKVLGFSGRRGKCKESGRGTLGNTFPRGAVVQERGDQVKGKVYK